LGLLLLPAFPLGKCWYLHAIFRSPSASFLDSLLLVVALLVSISGGILSTYTKDEIIKNMLTMHPTVINFEQLTRLLTSVFFEATNRGCPTAIPSAKYNFASKLA
jgi:hypothetical protein